MDNNEKLSAERSLKIISEAIEQSRTDIMRNAGMPMIFWGILTCGCVLFMAGNGQSVMECTLVPDGRHWMERYGSKEPQGQEKAYKLLQQSAQNIMDIFRSVCTHSSRHRHAFV